MNGRLNRRRTPRLIRDVKDATLVASSLILFELTLLKYTTLMYGNLELVG